MKPTAAGGSPPVARRVLDGSPVGKVAFPVHAIARLARARREAETRSERQPPRIRARVVPADGKGSNTLHRSDWLTPYTAETIAADALRAGRGARLEVTVAADATVTELAGVQRQFARLVNRGVEVSVRRDDQPQGQRVYPDRSVTAAPPEQLELPLHAGRPPIVVRPPR